MLDDFAALRITRYPMLPHLARVIELRNNLTAYDALYVALSETLRMPLLTQDSKFGRAALLEQPAPLIADGPITIG